MSTIVITDAQDGVRCPSCGAMDKNAWEWVGSEWEFNCGACGAVHEVADRHASMTIWLSREPKKASCVAGGSGPCSCFDCTGLPIKIEEALT